jgi:hypothetical protein
MSYCFNLSLGGRTWRLPTRSEALTLNNFQTYNPSISATFFPAIATGPIYYWNLNVYAPNSGIRAWSNGFTDGALANLAMTGTEAALCVSGTTKSSIQSFTDNSNETITDNATGLIWQKCSRGQSGTNCSGTALQDNWTNSNSYCNGLTLTGRTWRLPNVNELNSIVDLTDSTQPLFNSNFFPNTAIGNYWSSTTNFNSTTNAWLVENGGNIAFITKSSATLFTRCVSGP